jgi:hypothetical protein
MTCRVLSKILGSFLVLLLISNQLLGQELKPEITVAPAAVEKPPLLSPVMETAFAGVAGLEKPDKQWSVHLRSDLPKRNYGPEIEAIKARKNQIKGETYTGEAFEPGNPAVIDPKVQVNFEANWMLNGTPADDAIAVSREGFIVSCNNDAIEYYTSSGQLLYTDLWGNFFSRQNLNAVIYDPRIFYDSEADRFILVILHGSQPSNTTVVVAFSRGSDPRDGWNTYLLTGNPRNEGNWFDYPHIAVSFQELYITGNLFDANDNFVQAVIYQIPKNAGYAGQNLNWQFWSGLNADPYPAFSLVPAVYGWDGSYGPGCYFISGRAGGSNIVRLWDLTNYIGQNPELRVFNVATRDYEPAGDAFQLGTTERLDNGDCRFQHAFYLEGILHFVYHTDIGDGWNGISYNRLDIAQLSLQDTRFGLQGSFDYAYPGLVSFGKDKSDPSVMIGFLRSSRDIYPEVRVVSVDENLEWSSSVTVKSGDNYIDISQGSEERWGDYTGMSRDFGSGIPAVWMSGSYGGDVPTVGRFNVYKTRVARIVEDGFSSTSDKSPVTESQVFPNPVIDQYYVEFTIESKMPVRIDLVDNHGRLVKMLFEDALKAGEHSFSFNKDRLAAGTYHLRISSQNEILSHETIVISR